MNGCAHDLPHDCAAASALDRRAADGSRHAAHASLGQSLLADLGCGWTVGRRHRGGSTAWKLGPEARAIAVEARQRGVVVHMGRVNSRARMRYAANIGCVSCDGTYAKFSYAEALWRLGSEAGALSVQRVLL